MLETNSCACSSLSANTETATSKVSTIVTQYFFFFSDIFIRPSIQCDLKRMLTDSNDYWHFSDNHSLVTM